VIDELPYLLATPPELASRRLHMTPRSLGIRTDLIFRAHEGSIVDRGAYCVVRTPQQPSYFWGNYLIFPQPPAPAAVREWDELFAREFADQPDSSHRCYTWEARALSDPAEPAAVQAFERAGYDYDVSLILATSSVREPPHPNHAFRYRPLASEADWQQLLVLQAQSRDEDFAEAAYLEFLRLRVAHWRELVAQGHGLWLGAFEGERLVADAGLFWQADLGRFQNVETAEAYRRRGVCGTLIHELCRIGLARGLRELVMEADESYHAARVYESLGFQRVERIGALSLYDRALWGA
jgi:ribosomal protein S18 acetylase RimI-like enzyme